MLRDYGNCFSSLYRRASTALSALLLLASLILVGCDDAPDTRAYEQALREAALPAQEWRHYLGDAASSQYSSLTQINRDNVDTLQLAWHYRSGSAPHRGLAKMPCNPLIVKGILYCTSPDLAAFALNAATGEELWRYEGAVKADGFGVNALRGLAFWEADDDARVMFAANDKLTALNARTGRPIPTFGQNGHVSLRTGLPEWSRKQMVVATSPGAVYRDLLILGTRVGEFRGAAPGHIRAFDIRSGELKWMFRTIPGADEFGANTWPEGTHDIAGGANAWAGISIDQQRGIAFVPTGSASFDFYGGDRHGNNLFANTLLALDAASGQRLWHYQFVRHDVWDRDLPAPPNLVNIARGGKTIAAVAQATKTGHIFLFDRDTGKLLNPVEEVPVVGKALPGEQLAAHQPLPTSPPGFHAPLFIPSDRTTEIAAYVAHYVEKLDPYALFRAPSLNGTILYPGMDGGAEWGGLAYDPGSGLLYVNANEVPYLLGLTQLAEGQGSGIELAYLTQCAGCHGGDLRGDGVAVPSLVNLSERLSPFQAWRVVSEGQGRMPGFGALPFYARAAALWHVYRGDSVSPSVDEDRNQASGRAYINAGYQRFLDPEGMPASRPPWGSLTAINLNTSEIAWRIPFGDYPAMLASGNTGLGSENYGGPIVTAGGLLFIAATPDRKLKAYDKATGELLWQLVLPAGGFATPSTYMVDGRQYLVIAAGGGKLGDIAASEYLAFALPE